MAIKSGFLFHGTGSLNSHNYLIVWSMSKENLKLDERYLP